MAKYTVGQTGLEAEWGNKMWPVDVIAVHGKRGAWWRYEIRWKGFPNTATGNQKPTNESTYPECFILPAGQGPAVRAYTKKSVSTTKRAPVKKATIAKKSPKKSTAKPAKRATKVAAARKAPVFSAGKSKATKYKYSFCWQYFDNSKGGGDRGWHPYDFGASDTVEDAYQNWISNPAVDVRSVYSGHWNYTIDFNLMHQQNKDHASHTVRKIRRMAVGGGEAMGEAEATQKKVRAQRAGLLKEQNKGENSDAIQKRVSNHLEEQASALTRKRSKKGFVNVESDDQLQAGDKVRLKDKPVSNYEHYKAEYLGKEGTVSTVASSGFPPVLVKFDNIGQYYCVAVDLEKQA